MLLALLTALSLAQTCPDLTVEVDAARALFDDAELEQAKQEIERAYSAIGCQTRVIETGELLALYRLDGLVSLALNDRKGATYATIRAVAADHVDGAPPVEFGPDLAEEYRVWADRLGQALIYVRVAGSGTVHVDGRTLDASQWIQVTGGDHLIQIDTAVGLSSEVRELTESTILFTGQEGPNPVLLPVEADPVPAPNPMPAPVPTPISTPDPEPVAAKRRHPAGLFVGGLVAAGLGGAAIYWGSEREAAFAGRVYDEPIYGGCLVGQDCYAGARARAIKGDADLANALYGAGYGLCAVGAGLVTAGSVGVKGRPTMVHLSFRF